MWLVFTISFSLQWSTAVFQNPFVSCTGQMHELNGDGMGNKPLPLQILSGAIDLGCLSKKWHCFWVTMAVLGLLPGLSHSNRAHSIGWRHTVGILPVAEYVCFCVHLELGRGAQDGFGGPPWDIPVLKVHWALELHKSLLWAEGHSWEPECNQAWKVSWFPFLQLTATQARGTFGKGWEKDWQKKLEGPFTRASGHLDLNNGSSLRIHWWPVHLCFYESNILFSWPRTFLPMWICFTPRNMSWLLVPQVPGSRCVLLSALVLLCMLWWPCTSCLWQLSVAIWQAWDPITLIAFRFSNSVAAAPICLFCFIEEKSQKSSRILGLPSQTYFCGSAKFTQN